MRAVIQRVASASVAVSDAGALRETGRIGRGLLAFVGVQHEDGPEDVRYVVAKIREMRVFEAPEDPDRHMNRSVQDIGGAVLLVSEFTLAADCRKGRRPSFDLAAPPHIARPLYENVASGLREAGVKVETGEFQARMHVTLVNDGPVTMLLDSRKLF